jgi:cephalosporin hydroxylase
MARWRRYLPWLTGRANTALTPGLLPDLLRGILIYTYKGVPTLKCPFDMALYSQLLWREKPRTIFEIGSASGGSALWMSDQLKTFGIDGRIHSLDIKPVPITPPDNVTFYTGDVAKIADIFPSDWIEQQPRPFLVIDDGPHSRTSAGMVLKHFAPHMLSGEYILIEDGIVTALGDDSKFKLDGGPMQAVHDFLKSGAPFEIDRSYCDFFGHNVTWNVDGYLRRK